MLCLFTVEHVYEGQTLGRFFNDWLTTGKVARQDPDPGQTTGKVDCAWIDEWITVVKSARDPWTNPINPGEPWSLFATLASELGNNYHKDRLAILLSRLNRKKEHVGTCPDVFYVNSNDYSFSNWRRHINRKTTSNTALMSNG